MPDRSWQDWASAVAVLSFVAGLLTVGVKKMRTIMKSVRRLLLVPQMVEAGLERIQDVYDQTVVNHDIGQMMAERNGIMVWRSDVDGNNTYTSDYFVRRTGYSKEQLERGGWEIIVAPEDRERVYSTWMDSVGRGFEFDETYILVTANDEQIKVRSQARPIRDVYGSPVSWVGYLIPQDEQTSDPEHKALQAQIDMIAKQFKQERL